MVRLKPKESVIKRLFALSGNQCAYPGCEENIVDELGTVIGEICHIEAAEIGGERYNEYSNDELRKSFENLILMCSNHHKKCYLMFYCFVSFLCFKILMLMNTLRRLLFT